MILVIFAFLVEWNTTRNQGQLFSMLSDSKLTKVANIESLEPSTVPWEGEQCVVSAKNGSWNGRLTVERIWYKDIFGNMINGSFVSISVWDYFKGVYRPPCEKVNINHSYNNLITKLLKLIERGEHFNPPTVYSSGTTVECLNKDTTTRRVLPIFGKLTKGALHGVLTAVMLRCIFRRLRN